MTAEICAVLNFTLADVDPMGAGELAAWHAEATRIWQLSHPD